MTCYPPQVLNTNEVEVLQNVATSPLLAELALLAVHVAEESLEAADGKTEVTVESTNKISSSMLTDDTISNPPIHYNYICNNYYKIIISFVVTPVSKK